MINAVEHEASDEEQEATALMSLHPSSKSLLFGGTGRTCIPGTISHFGVMMRWQKTTSQIIVSKFYFMNLCLVLFYNFVVID